MNSSRVWKGENVQHHRVDFGNRVPVEAGPRRPTMHFVAIKTPEQMDLLALHRVRSRLVSQRTGVINQIRGFLIERGITVRQGVGPLRKALPDILSQIHTCCRQEWSISSLTWSRTGVDWTSALRRCQLRSNRLRNRMKVASG